VKFTEITSITYLEKPGQTFERINVAHNNVASKQTGKDAEGSLGGKEKVNKEQVKDEYCIGDAA
jgi:hypothetical protein